MRHARPLNLPRPCEPETQHRSTNTRDALPAHGARRQILRRWCAPRSSCSSRTPWAMLWRDTQRAGEPTRRVRTHCQTNPERLGRPGRARRAPMAQNRDPRFLGSRRRYGASRFSRLSGFSRGRCLGFSGRGSSRVPSRLLDFTRLSAHEVTGTDLNLTGFLDAEPSANRQAIRVLTR